MTKYAYFDHLAQAPLHVLGWYDTDLVEYPELPAPEDLLEMTEVQWAQRMNDFWIVENGQLVPGPQRVLVPGQETPTP